MQRYEDFVFLVEDGLQVVEGATVTVYFADTTTTATIYSDNGVTPKSNPTTSAADGSFFFYAANDLYDIKVEHADLTTETRQDILLFDPIGTPAAADEETFIRDLDVTVHLQTPTAAPGSPAAGDIWELAGVLKHGASSKSIATLSTEQSWSAQQTVTAPATSGKIPLILKGNATAAADILDIYDSAATPIKQSWFDSTGLFGTNLNITFKSGTSFTMTFDHALAANRTVTFPDAGAAASVAYTTTPGTSGSDINWGATGVLNVPDASATARGVVTTGAQTIAGAKAFTGAMTLASTFTLTSSNAAAVSVGRQGATDPAFKIDASAASSVTGIEIVAAAAAGGVNLRAISSGADENLTVNAKGSGTVSINPTGTGNITLARATGVTGALTVTSTGASALAVGANGSTNPVLKIDASTASVATGLSVTGAAAAGGLAVAVISSGADENLTINAKGSGTIGIGTVSTGAITLTRATTCASTLGVTGVTTLSSNLIAGSDTTDRVTIKGIYMSPANVVVAVPAITDPDIAKVDVSVAAAFSMQPAEGDAVIAIPQEAMEANARILGCYVTATDQITVVFGSEGGNVTGGNKNFKFLVMDVT